MTKTPQNPSPDTAEAKALNCLIKMGQSLGYNEPGKVPSLTKLIEILADKHNGLLDLTTNKHNALVQRIDKLESRISQLENVDDSTQKKAEKQPKNRKSKKNT